MASPGQLSCSTLPSTNFVEHYDVIRSLGAGKYGQVKEVQHKGTKRRFAWKQVPLREKEVPETAAEAEILRRVQHENIIQIYEVHTTPGVLHLVLELCSRGSMKQYMKSKVAKCDGLNIYCSPSRWEIATTLHQLLSAVSFLHSNGVAHRDIKPDNVLLSEKTWKLADFNLACNFVARPGKLMRNKAGSRPFMAPEVQEKGRYYTEKCDIYSLGILLIALRTGRHYWRPDCCEDEQIVEESKNLLSEERWYGLGCGALPFALEMISPEEDRCDAEEALGNPWLVRQVTRHVGGDTDLQGGAASCCTIS